MKITEIRNKEKEVLVQMLTWMLLATFLIK